MIPFPFTKPSDPDAKAAKAAPERMPEDAPERTLEDAPRDAAPEAVAAEPGWEVATPADAEAVADHAAESGRTPDADPLGAPDLEEQTRMVEAMLFASEKPLSTAELASRMPVGADAAVAVRRLEEIYAPRGVQLVRVAGKWAFRTAPDLAHLLSSEVVEQRKLSKAAVETLAIIAYHQPVTRAEIEEIRQVGVSKGTIDLLMEIGWVKLGRRRQTPGRPVTFVSTDAFLAYFGLDSLKDLPRLEELRQAGLFESRPPVGFESALGLGAEADPDRAAAREDAEADDDEHEDEMSEAERKDSELLL